jgi:hypothetical protein
MLLQLHCGALSRGMAPFVSMHMAEAKELADGSIMIDQSKEPEHVGILVMN